MEVALDLLSFPIYCWPWPRLLRCGPNLVFKRTEMMRPLLGIVFSPSDKRGLTGPLLLHTMVTNRLVTELHPDWYPNMQWPVSCPDQDYVKCLLTHLHLHSSIPIFSLCCTDHWSIPQIPSVPSSRQPRFVHFRLLLFVWSLIHQITNLNHST